MIYLSDHQTIASQCPKQPLLNQLYMDCIDQALMRSTYNSPFFLRVEVPLHVSVVRASLILAWLLCGQVWAGNPYLPYQRHKPVLQLNLHQWNYVCKTILTHNRKDQKLPKICSFFDLPCLIKKFAKYCPTRILSKVWLMSKSLRHSNCAFAGCQ